jgi:hypothetical protein
MSVSQQKIIKELKAQREDLHVKCKKAIEEEDRIHTCSRAEGLCCSVYAFPKAKWRNGDCPMADTELREIVEQVQEQKIRVGQQKQKKK